MNPTISPADTYSTMSTPQTNWSPLLKAEDDATMAPSEMALSPDNSQWDASSPMAERSGDGSQKKKRKSWGQELPVPKTNLPPRKRAKTEDEKEQRRVERVLRNRRAAQTSRERKSREKETLEEELRQTKQTLEEVQSENAKLLAEIIKFRAGMTVFDMDIPIKSEQNTETSLSVGIQKALQASTCPAVVEPGCTFVDQETYTLPITTPADADDDISKVVAESSSTATSSDLTQQPAVSVRRHSASMEDEQLGDSPFSSSDDGYDYHHNLPLDDDALGDLFNPPADLPVGNYPALAEDGFPAYASLDSGSKHFDDQIDTLLNITDDNTLDSFDHVFHMHDLHHVGADGSLETTSQLQPEFSAPPRGDNLREIATTV